ncbi:DUF5683 domain-containing protein [soil metagenome]
MLFFVFYSIQTSAQQIRLTPLNNTFSNFNRSELRQNLFNRESNSDTINTVKKFVMHKSPLKAVLYSALLPSLGQFYNESYWKIPVIVGLGGYFGYNIIDFNNIANNYEAQYVSSQTPENPNGNLRLKQLRELNKDNRDQFIFYFGILYLANLVDAYVDAHLYDFDVSEKSRFSLTKNPGRVSLSIDF